MNPHGIVPMNASVRKYGSQGITKCHHPIGYRDSFNKAELKALLPGAVAIATQLDPWRPADN